MSPQKRNQISNYRKTCFSCLPDDILCMIFILLPVDILHNVMKNVCKGWSKIIESPTFITAHLKKYSTPKAILIHHPTINGFVVKPKKTNGRLFDVKKVNLQFVNKVFSSCNGLLLVNGPIEPFTDCPTHVVNPVTKQFLPLPPFPSPIQRFYGNFAYASASREYKVIHGYDKSRWVILTLGVDKEWRKIDAITQLSDTAMNVIMMRAYYGGRLSLNGFVYWLCNSIPLIIRFDMEKETFGEIPFSHPSLSDCDIRLFAMKSSLCVSVQSWTGESLMEFWLLKNPETGHGQWEKMFDFDIQSPRRLHPLKYRPIEWLRDMELLVFHSIEDILVYDVNTGEVYQTEDMKITKNPLDMMYSYVGSHTDSLVLLNNLSLVPSTPKEHEGISGVQGA